MNVKQQMIEDAAAIYPAKPLSQLVHAVKMRNLTPVTAQDRAGLHKIMNSGNYHLVPSMLQDLFGANEKYLEAIKANRELAQNQPA